MEEYRYALEKARSVNLKLTEKGMIVGFVGAFVHGGWKVGTIYTLNVHPSVRGRGLGQKLLAAIERRLAHEGCLRVVLQVHVANAAAIGLYEGAGYERLRFLRNYYQVYEPPHAYLYGKPLPG